MQGKVFRQVDLLFPAATPGGSAHPGTCFWLESLRMCRLHEQLWLQPTLLYIFSQTIMARVPAAYDEVSKALQVL